MTLLQSSTGVFQLAESDDSFELGPYGAYLLGYQLEKLEWALATMKDTVQLAAFLGNLRVFARAKPVQDIGREASRWNDTIANMPPGDVPDTAMNSLRDARTRWETLAQERLMKMFLISSRSNIASETLTKGANGLLNESDVSLLTKTEIGDLWESCWCIMVSAPTSAEFMALRAAESILRRWYKGRTGKTIGRGPWGRVLERLEKEFPTEAERPKELWLLSYLRERRNEVAHPERTSSMLEAEATLLNVAILVVGLRETLIQFPVEEPEQGRLLPADASTLLSEPTPDSP